MLGKFIAGDFIAIAGEMHRLQMKKRFNVKKINHVGFSILIL
jgi:hypothetical protein